MGIQSRDYVRDSGPVYRGGGISIGSGGEGAGWKWLIGITVAVYFLQMLTRSQGQVLIDDNGSVFLSKSSSIESWLLLDPELVFKGQVWRLLTYAFCHSGFMHIFFNMLWIWFFGRTLEQIYGTREYICFYLASAIFAGLVYLGFGIVLRDPAPVVGASGAVLASVMLMALHFPRQELLYFGLIRIQMRWMVLIIVVLDALPVLQQFGGPTLRDGVAHTAHLGGLAFGFLYHHRQWRISPLFDGGIFESVRRKMKRRPKNVRVYEPPVEEARDRLEEQVDAILEKIHEKGEASLTDSERETLKRASNRYKKR